MSRADVRQIQEYFEGLFRAGTTPWTEHELEPEVGAFAEKLLAENAGPVLLDIGCGNGWVSLYFASRGIRVTGIDSSKTAIAQAQQAAQATGMGAMATFVVGDGLALPHEDASFEAVFDRGFFHHVPEDEYGRYLDEVSRVLKDGGWLSLHAFTKRNREGIGHRFAVEDIRRIFGERFELLENSEDPWPTQAPAHLGHYLLRKH